MFYFFQAELIPIGTSPEFWRSAWPHCHSR